MIINVLKHILNVSYYASFTLGLDIINKQNFGPKGPYSLHTRHDTIKLHSLVNLLYFYVNSPALPTKSNFVHWLTWPTYSVVEEELTFESKVFTKTDDLIVVVWLVDIVTRYRITITLIKFQEQLTFTYYYMFL